MMVRTSTLWLIAASVALSACSDRKLTRIVDDTIVVYDNKLASCVDNTLHFVGSTATNRQQSIGFPRVCDKSWTVERSQHFARIGESIPRFLNTFRGDPRC
jgi:hypothetical protein